MGGGEVLREHVTALSLTIKHLNKVKIHFSKATNKSLHSYSFHAII